MDSSTSAPAYATEAKTTHWLAVLSIAATATVFGGGFAAMQTVLNGGLSVGAAITVRFCLATVLLGAILLVRRTTITRQGLLDGAVLGVILVTIFWLQTDGLRFTTTSKSAFITSLYVPFTPLMALVLGDRVRVHHAIGAVLATIGLLALVHVPGGVLSGWNRGDFETLIVAVFCAAHLTATSHFSRRTSGWVLAFVQMAVVALLSLPITLLLPAPNGFQGAIVALSRHDVQIAMTYMVVLNSVFAFWAQSTMQAHLSSTETAVIFSLEPVVAGLVGVFWVGESLSGMQLLGAVLILFAMLAAEILPRLFYRDPVAIAEAETEVP